MCVNTLIGNENIINVQNYLKVCPSVPDLISFLPVHKSNPDPHVLLLWMKNLLLAPLDHEPMHNMQRNRKIYSGCLSSLSNWQLFKTW